MGEKLAVITGGNNGLGFGCACAIAATEGWSVVIICRDAKAGEAAVAAITRKTGNTKVSCRIADLADLKSVRRLTEGWKEPIDALICNAGMQVVKKTPATVDGFERTFQVNYLAHFFLVNLLIPKLAHSARILNVASAAHDPAQKTGLPAPRWTIPREMARRVPGDREGPIYFGLVAYSTSKLCNVLFTYELARLLPTIKRGDVDVNAYDPGGMLTGIIRGWPFWARWLAYGLRPLKPLFSFLTTAEESGAKLAELATSSEFLGVSGKYFTRKGEIRSSVESYDQGKQRELWEQSRRLVESVLQFPDYVDAPKLPVVK